MFTIQPISFWISPSPNSSRGVEVSASRLQSAQRLVSHLKDSVDIGELTSWLKDFDTMGFDELKLLLEAAKHTQQER